MRFFKSKCRIPNEIILFWFRIKCFNPWGKSTEFKLEMLFWLKSKVSNPGGNKSEVSKLEIWFLLKSKDSKCSIWDISSGTDFNRLSVKLKSFKDFFKGVNAEDCMDSIWLDEMTRALKLIVDDCFQIDLSIRCKLVSVKSRRLMVWLFIW